MREGGATFYHIEFLPQSGQTLYDMDLSEEETHHLSLRLASGKTVPIGGRPVRWEQAQSVRVARSELPWADVYHGAMEDLRRRKIADMQHHKQWHVFDRAEDVTHAILNQAIAEERSPESEVPDPREVFVVHGRNERAREALFEFLSAINLRPIEFVEALRATGKPNPYVGDVLEKAFSMAQAIVVLFTPDDEAWLRDEYQVEHDPAYETDPTPQARPNVLFEAGMAMGRDPNRTVLVQLGEVRPFSDVAGRHILRIDDSSQRRQQLADRLMNAGCDVKLAGVRWHSAGGFSEALPEGIARKKPASSRVNDAMVRAFVDKDFNSTGRMRHLLVLENTGDGEARDVEVAVDDLPAEDHTAVFIENKITHIGPRTRCHYLLALTSDGPPPSKVRVGWVNESGEPGQFNSSLSV